MTEPTNLWDKADMEMERLRQLYASAMEENARLRNQLDQERVACITNMRLIAEIAQKVAREALL